MIGSFGMAAYQRQGLEVYLGQLAQGLVGKKRGIDVGDDAGQVAQAAFFIEQTRLFLAGAAVTNEFHVTLSGD